MAASPDTQPSLLIRIRDQNNSEAWSQFVEIYGPLVYGFFRGHTLQDADAADLTQSVLGDVAAATKTFQYDPSKGSFRNWLFTLAQNRLRNFRRSEARTTRGTGDTQAYQVLMQQPQPGNGQAAEWEKAYERHLFQYAARQVRGDFQETTWIAFWRTAVDGEKPADVADCLGTSVASVYLAKARVVARIKQHVLVLTGEQE